MTANPLLFSPLRIRDVELRNRIVVPPMWQYSAKHGHPNDWHTVNLGRYAYGGAALVFQEGTSVERRGCGTIGDIGIWKDDFIPELARISQVISSAGAVPGIQLAHAGRKARQRSPMDGRGPLPRDGTVEDWEAWKPIGPSAIAASEDFEVPLEMSMADILAVQESFIEATRRADEAGYEIINLHAGHGYLLHQFLSPASNQRTDNYGGSLANRIRFLLEVIEGMRKVWPASKPIFLRLSCEDGHGWLLDDTISLVKQAVPLGIDVFDCSSGGITGSSTNAKHATPTYGYQVRLARAVKQATGVLTSAVGLIVHADQAESILQAGDADLIAIGREFLYNPNWAIDAAQKLEANCQFSIAHPTTQYFLERRAISAKDVVPSTFRSGLGEPSIPEAR